MLIVFGVNCVETKSIVYKPACLTAVNFRVYNKDETLVPKAGLINRIKLEQVMKAIF